MLNILKGVLGSPRPAEEPADEKNRITVATCVILLEMSHADGEFHDMEAVIMDDLLKRKFNLPSDMRKELIEFAHKEREGSLDLYQFTRQINENFNSEEKKEILKALWHIVYADKVLDKYEDFLIRKLTKLLRLSHRQMIEAKVQVLDEIGRDSLESR